MKPILLLSLTLSLVFQSYNGAGQITKRPNFFSTLSPGAIRSGFVARSVYLNEGGQPMGARFIHQASGYTLDLVQIESVPQAFIWVNSVPVSDKGEPHTQEHLLIGKGNKGRNVAGRVGMSLGEFNAYTSQLHTVYDFSTAAGAEVFYSLFDQFMDALMHPDYTDEEVSREVRNWGVTENADKTLRLEEKGSVYNEMSSAMNSPGSLLYDSICRLVYGSQHPLAFSAGGLPADIRILDAKAIADFHRNNYFPANMGAIVSLPSTITPESALTRMDELLKKAIVPGKPIVPQQYKLPSWQPSKNVSTAIINVPTANAQEPSGMMLGYPDNLRLDATEFILLSTFLQVFAGDATSNLYKIFINSSTRQNAVQPQSLYAFVNDDDGYNVMLGLDGIPAGSENAATADTTRALIRAELERIASFKDGSPELKEFNKQFSNNLIALQRIMNKLVNTPPRFGARNTSDTWYDQLQLLDRQEGFKKSLVLKPQIEAVMKIVSQSKNPWREYLTKWNLLKANPYVVISKGAPVLLEQMEQSNKERAAEAVAMFGKEYNLSDPQTIISRYKSKYDSTSTEMEKLEESAPMKFLANPPLTLDDQLKYTRTKINGMVPLLSSQFNSMSSATVGIAFDLHAVPSDKLVYLAIFPQLLTGTGVIRNGKAINYEEMSQQLLQQILALNSYYGGNRATGRAELVIKGSGNNQAEAVRAVQWMKEVLSSPNWTKENLPRLRDMVDQRLASIRQTMQNAEENWVGGPAFAMRNQDQPLQLVAGSFLTAGHNILRMKWMLRHTDNVADSTAIDGFLSRLGGANADRTSLQQLLSYMSGQQTSIDSVGNNKGFAKDFSTLTGEALALMKEMARDLQQVLNELPDNSVPEDWKYLCATLQRDVAQTTSKTLNDLHAIKKSLLNQHNARAFIIGSASSEARLTKELQGLLTGFATTNPTKHAYVGDRFIDQRVMERYKVSTPPVFSGLINPNSQTGVFINYASMTSYFDTTQGSMLRLLAAELYAGSGKQSVFSKTIGAGLAYSNGVGVDPHNGTIFYYAERTPELPQTLKFAIEEVKRTPVDSAMIDYTFAHALAEVRSSREYELRGEAMAADFADGVTPELVSRFRTSLLKLRNDKNLLSKIYAYKNAVYETILPGYGVKSKDVKGGNFFVVGPEKQMQAYEAYLSTVNGEDGKLYRLYPRDFWMVSAK